MKSSLLFNGSSGLETEIGVTAVEGDSRKVIPGACFVAVKGFATDGHLFINEAVKMGASIVVVEGNAPVEGIGVPVVRVADSRKELARLADRFFGHPSQKLGVIGITGTNGKTTTSFMLQRVLNDAGFLCSRFGTIDYEFPDVSIPAPNTTPESVDLQRMFARAADAQNPRCVMEVSSHGLALGRLDGTSFKGAVFTNLTQDHLDFHHTMEEYETAKQKLFTDFGLQYAVINRDDPAGGRWIAKGVKGRLLSFGASPKADIRLVRSSTDINGGHMLLATPLGEVELNIPLPGIHNIQNAMAAFSAGVGEGFSAERIVQSLSSLAAVPGRFEKVDGGQDFGVVVDYAHTDNALANVLRTASGITQNRLICVFGCGGDRDPGKRPLMGRVAADMADYVIVTSDNPRTEDPEKIIAAVLGGIPAKDRNRVEAVTLRADAIRRALEMAKPGDTVLIAGKGHEDYQIIGKTKHPFDDRKVAAGILREMKR
ncbi:MAG: UDP-N-acetylmuramoyl-L-alanyl-D-glutamate--2,6-diaminopimelate ligase [Nitrospinae bacterium]|nr:UDP-N-acetylmuramoyl-L-alanyl-D-glutamate--2,6-diaminopimelate ligase [Nitrospinota bacterium]